MNTQTTAIGPLNNVDLRKRRKERERDCVCICVRLSRTNYPSAFSFFLYRSFSIARSNLAIQCVSIRKICVLLFIIFSFFQFQTVRSTFTLLGFNFTFNLNKISVCEKKTLVRKCWTQNNVHQIKQKKGGKSECCAWDLTEYTIYCFCFARFFFITPLTCALFPHRGI